MKIVVTDGETLNPGDLDMSSLKKLGDLRTYNFSDESNIAERLKDAEIAVVNKTVISRELLDKLPKLKFVAVTATGYNNIDLRALKDRNISASNVSDYGSYAVAQHTFALLLELTNWVSVHHRECMEGKWNQVKNFCFWSRPMTELYGKKMGIIGLGNIGRRTAEIAAAFGMEILYHSRTDKHIDRFQYVDTAEEIFQNCDVVSLHCTLNDGTEQIINKNSLKLFKPEAFLLNTSRGGLVNEKELAQALDSGVLAAYAADVLSVEPPREKNILIHHPKCIITPHNAWSSKDTRQRILDITIDNIRGFIEGSPKNRIV